MTESTLCPICLEDNILLNCAFCNYKTCGSCIMTFFSEKYDSEPYCLDCKKILSREEIIEKCDRKWFYHHIGYVLMEQEKMFIPETQKEARLIMEINELRDQLNKLKPIYKIKDEDMADEQRVKKRVLETQIKTLKEQTITFSNIPEKKIPQKEGKTNYIMKCPEDNCRGFINNNYECEICKTKICKKCNTSKKNNHSCKKEDIETAALIKKDTKKCPKCMTDIFKASGCSQIWCTQCHTTFDWETGQIDTSGIIHNPHYYQWLQKNNTAVGENPDINCHEIPTAQAFHYRLYAIKAHGDLMNIHRVYTHINQVVRPVFEMNRVKDNFDLRVEYLLNNFDEDKWASKLSNREKRRMKNLACLELITLSLRVFEEWIRRVMYTDNYHEVYKEYINFGEFFKESLDKIIELHGGYIHKSMIIFDD